MKRQAQSDTGHTSQNQSWTERQKLQYRDKEIYDTTIWNLGSSQAWGLPLEFLPFLSQEILFCLS